MRAGYRNEFILVDNAFIGINLGADFCSEHEWGIKGIRRAFGLSDDQEVFGLARRAITQIPSEEYKEFQLRNSGYLYTEFSDKAILMYSIYAAKRIQELQAQGKEITQEDLPRDLKLRTRDHKLGTAWSENDFGIIVRGKENKEKLREIHDAFLRKDIAIWLGGGGVFQNAGLGICIASKVPERWKEEMYNNDKEHFEVQEAAAATGIQQNSVPIKTNTIYQESETN
jgi:hypothetical protein